MMHLNLIRPQVGDLYYVFLAYFNNDHPVWFFVFCSLILLLVDVCYTILG